MHSEVTSELSVFFYEDAEVYPGLSIMPEALAQASSTIATTGPHACTTCGQVTELRPARRPRLPSVPTRVLVVRLHGSARDLTAPPHEAPHLCFAPSYS